VKKWQENNAEEFKSLLDSKKAHQLWRGIQNLI
jgi:hypothetical protein